MSNGTIRQRTYLFTDLRHIRCGNLEWYSPEGNPIPLIDPPEPQVHAHARTGYVPHGIRIVAQRARITEPLRRGSVGSVILEDGIYRSWSIAGQFPPGRNFGSYSKDMPLSVAIRYSESKDGFDWTEPASYPIDVPGQTGFDGPNFFVDPKGPPSERYKVIYSAIPPREQYPSLWENYSRLHPRYRDVRLAENKLHCVYAAISPDGVNWKPIREPLMVHQSDTDTCVYYDSWLDRYVMYTRLYNQERRWIGRAEAEDFYHWGPVEPLIWPGLDLPFSHDVYTNARTEYPGLPGYHLMFPMFYHRYDQTSDVHLFSSVDGICWNRVPGSPMISPGEPDAWDGEYIHAQRHLVPLGPDRVAIQYSGSPYPHKYPRWPGRQGGGVAWAWWPSGRLAAVVADEVGEFYTFPLVPAGRELRLNVRARRGSEVRVGIVGIPGRSAEDCDPIYGDSLSIPVHWKGETDIGAKDGQRFTLNFRMRSAELFGFEWV